MKKKIEMKRRRGGKGMICDQMREMDCMCLAWGEVGEEFQAI